MMDDAGRENEFNTLESHAAASMQIAEKIVGVRLRRTIFVGVRKPLLQKDLVAAKSRAMPSACSAVRQSSVAVR